MSHSDPCARCLHPRRSHIDTVAGLLCPTMRFVPLAPPAPSPLREPEATMAPGPLATPREPEVGPQTFGVQGRDTPEVRELIAAAARLLATEGKGEEDVVHAAPVGSKNNPPCGVRWQGRVLITLVPGDVTCAACRTAMYAAPEVRPRKMPPCGGARCWQTPDGTTWVHAGPVSPCSVYPAPLREPEATTACPTCGCTESDVRGVNLKCRNCERIFAPAPLATEGKGEETPAPGSDARRLPAGTLVTCETCPMPHPKDDDGRLCRFPKVAAPASRETEREGP